MSVPGNRRCYCRFWDRHFFERFRFSFVLGSPLSCDFAFWASLCYQRRLSWRKRAVRWLPFRRVLIQFPPGRGKRPCRFNSESETRVSVSVFFLYGFSLIVRLVREVIKIVDARLEETQVGSKTEGLAKDESLLESWANVKHSRKARERQRLSHEQIRSICESAPKSEKWEKSEAGDVDNSGLMPAKWRLGTFAKVVKIWFIL